MTESDYACIEDIGKEIKKLHDRINQVEEQQKEAKMITDLKIEKTEKRMLRYANTPMKTPEKTKHRKVARQMHLDTRKRKGWKPWTELKESAQYQWERKAKEKLK